MEHTYITRHQGGVQRANCGRWARSTRARLQLDSQKCLGGNGVNQMRAKEKLERQAIKQTVETDDLVLAERSCEATSLAMLAVERQYRDWRERQRAAGSGQQARRARHDRQGGGVEEEGSRVGHCQGKEAL